MPFVLLLMGAVTLALVASNGSAKTPKPARSPYNLDPDLNPLLRAQIEAALHGENDPSHLEAFASGLESRYPYAAGYLRTKAAVLRRMGTGAPAPAALPPASVPMGIPHPSSPAAALPVDGLDANLPDNVRFNVVELLTSGSDPAVIETFAAQLGSFPLAQAALRMRAAFLRSLTPQQPGRPASMGLPSVPSPAPAPAPAPGPAPSLRIPGLDPNMPPELAMQVAQALMTENDPSRLREFGNALQASFPSAATLLLAKANVMPAPRAQPSPEPAPSAPLPPSLPVPSFPVPSFPLPSGPGLLDAGMTPEDQARIVTALSSETDPDKLRQLAHAVAARYPKAALLLTTKADAIATLLLGPRPPAIPAPAPAPAIPASPAFPVPFSPPLPSSLPPPASGKRTYKVQSGDFPIKIAKKYGQPESAWKELVAANPNKRRAADGNFKSLLPGEELVIPSSWPDRELVLAPAKAPNPPPTSPAPTPSAAPAGALVPPGAAALDPGMPANVAQAVLTALATESDPATLRGFAASIMATYPIAAGVLLAKANAVGILVVAAPGAASKPAAPPRGAPTSGGSTYRVVAGDSPSRIAKRLTGTESRWPELVAANPQKPKAPNGNFKSLQPGDVLQLPPSWSTATTPTNGAPTAARA